ncbi:MAG TPA: apolipoprotein N-acyltransferase [Candidatus Polarisedimenticolia bacterium]|nr:apolipoprotein N-acyltransferase [Candidatus Polarisedimenticolia bacterium]
MTLLPARRAPLYAAAGGLLALAFPLGPPLPFSLESGLWPAGWIALAPLLAGAVRAARPAEAAAGGLLAGTVGYALLMPWMGPFLMRWGLLSWVEAAAVTAALVLYMAIFPGVFAWGVRFLGGRAGTAAALLASPCLWVALELARGRLFTGFPWCLLGYSQAGFPAAIQVAGLAGVYGVSFALACSSAGVAALILGRAPGARGVRRAGAGLLACASGVLLYGVFRLAQPAAEAAIPVALVQANVPQSDKWDPSERDRIEARHVGMTREAAARGARLIVWSESSVPYSITRHPEYERRLRDLAAETGAELLVGTVAYEPRGGRMAPLNSAYLVLPGGAAGGRYDKQHLVPFGEYVPLRRLLFFLEPLVQEAGDFEPGPGGAPLPAAAGSIGTLICYEAIFPELAAAWGREGAQILANLTNDAWYGDTAMPRQHLAQSVVRAVEAGRWLLRCANTGISAIVDPRGRITASAPLGRTELLEGRVAALTGTTLYAAAGDVFAFACAIVGVAALAAALLRPPSERGAAERSRRSSPRHAVP